MERFRVVRYYTYCLDVEVEAENADEAYRKTEEEAESAKITDYDFVDTDGFIVLNKEGDIVLETSN